MQLIEDRDDEYQGAFSDDKSVEASKPGASWSEIADQQRADAETAQINANRQAFDQYIAIEQGAKQQKLALDHQRAIAGAAMIQSAARNGGMSDRSLSAAFSEAFGQPIYGGQLVQGIDMGNGPETVLAMYGATKDPQTGKAVIGPVAMMGSREMLQILKRAGLGDTTNDLQNRIIDNSYLGKLTDDQRAAMGVSRPSVPISTGTTVISGAAMRALRGTPRQRNMEGGHFAADGRGGFTQSYFNRATGENWQADYGTRDPNRRAAKWKVLESAADYTRYENDQTGEVVKVPKGETIQNVLRGTSEKEKVAKIQAQGKVDAAQTQAQTRISAEESKSRQNRERQYNSWLNTQMNALNRKLDGMRRATTGVTNQPRWSNEEIDKTEREGLAAIEQRGQTLFADVVGGGQPATTTQKQGGQAQASSGDNTKSGEIQEFNPKGRYKAGDRFSRKGVVYEVGNDGQPHRVK